MGAESTSSRTSTFPDYRRPSFGIKRFFRLYKFSPPEDILPMNIEEFGNSSVATIPTLFDLVRKTNYKGHSLTKGDIIMFASVGAGMNINAITYKI